MNSEADHTNYLKVAATEWCTSFITDAESSKFRDPMVDSECMKGIREDLITLNSETYPIQVIDIIRFIVEMCYHSVTRDPLYHPDLGQRKVWLLRHISMIYDVFCLGFADMCCTMNDERSIIDESQTVVEQIAEFKQARGTIRTDIVAKYPEVLSWVKLCGRNWVQGFEYIEGKIKYEERLDFYYDDDERLSNAAVFMTRNKR